MKHFGGHELGNGLFGRQAEVLEPAHLREVMAQEHAATAEKYACISDEIATG
ncbi:MAG: hypothetical protein HWN68_06260 [Desulfobacterales bacterium]|nr:hypothetical protein [Desulfobacterales bacterium]